VSPEFNVEVEFDVYCGKCGNALCPQSRTDDYRRGYGGQTRAVHVDPCDRCLDEAKSEGYDEGYSVAQNDADST
jgi:hypothetical protein